METGNLCRLSEELRNGKDDCTSHRIREEVLDKTVWDYTKQKEILRLGQKIDKLVMEKIQIQQ